MSAPIPTETVQSIIERIRPGSTMLDTRPLSNADAQKMTAVELQRASGERETLVIRRHTPERIAREARLLNLLRDTALPVSEVHQAETTYMIQHFLPGESRFSPANVTACVQTMAQTLAQIHQTSLPPDAITFLPDMHATCQQQIQNRPAALQSSMGEPQIRNTLERDWHTLTHHPPGLLHGDFWPGNVLWQGEYISGVVDWEDAAFGDPLADLGNSRREVLWFFGKEAMQHFTEAYQAQMPHLDYRNLPYWDLCMALTPVGNVSSWCLDESAKQRFRQRQRWLVNQACETLKTHTVN